MTLADFALSIGLCSLAAILVLGGIELYNDARRLVRCWRVKKEQQRFDREWAAMIESQRRANRQWLEIQKARKP